MDEQELRGVMEACGLGVKEAARVTGYNGDRTFRRMLDGSKPVPGAVAILMRIYERHPDILDEELDNV